MLKPFIFSISLSSGVKNIYLAILLKLESQKTKQNKKKLQNAFFVLANCFVTFEVFEETLKKNICRIILMFYVVFSGSLSKLFCFICQWVSTFFF